MRKVKFRGTSPRNNNNDIGNDDVYASEDDSSTCSSEDDLIAFSGWARVFFQARCDCSATQVTAPGVKPFLDTHLHLAIHATANELCISDPRHPPIALKHFYAARVPGSRSGAALFLRNDPKRRLRK